MKKILSMILVLALAFALTVSSLSALATAPVVAFSSEESGASSQGENTPGGNGGSDTGGSSGGSDTGDKPGGGSGTGGESGGGSGTGGESGGGSGTGGESGGGSGTGGESGGGSGTGGESGGGSGTGGESGGGSGTGGESGDTTPSNPTPPTDPPTNPPTSGKPIITKHPTGENVREGGYAEFVARADSCLDIIWHLQNPGGSIDVLAEKAPERFPGLIVTGLNSERLGLDRIPKALDEWRVRAEFVGLDGNVWSDPAVISVMNQELTAPTIQRQPASANLKPTEGTALQISALTSEQNTTLTYQWYKNTINSNVGGKAILGATSASFTPDYEPGTTYYYCAVRCTNGSEISAATKTTCAAVTYITAQGQESTAPTRATTPTVTVSPTASTLTPWGEATATEETLPTVIPDAPTRSNNLLLVVVGMIILIAILGIVATVIILKLYGDRQEAPRRQEPPKRPAAPAASSQRRASQSGEAAHTPKFAAKQPPADEDPAWDDLSDLGDLSIYFDDEDDPE